MAMKTNERSPVEFWDETNLLGAVWPRTSGVKPCGATCCGDPRGAGKPVAFNEH